MLLKTGVDLSERLSDFVSKAEDLFIFVPYIKLEALTQLLSNAANCKAIIVRWEARDLVLGISDLEVYNYCKQRGIALYRNPRIHLKAFVDNYKTCILGSANISARALDIPKTNHFNYEAATFTSNLSIDDRLYFNIILSESILVTDSIYHQFESQLPEKKKEFPQETEFEFKIESPDKNFLISALPMTYSVKTLLRICETKETINEVELNCAMHDLALFKLPLGLPPNELREQLKAAFFGHPFVTAFLMNLEGHKEIFFGAAKDWIHKNCTDVPTPRKWEITENIQILYRWIVDLGDGKYKVDVPGAHSERLSLA